MIKFLIDRGADRDVRSIESVPLMACIKDPETLEYLRSLPDPPRYWTIENHCQMPDSFQRAVLTIVLIRSFEHSNVWSLIPNELLFTILSMIERSAFDLLL